MKNRRRDAKFCPWRRWFSFGMALMLSLLSAASVAAQQPVLLGDLDADGQITVIDLQLLLNHLGSVKDAFQLAPNLLPYADVNEDGYINQADLGMVRDAILGIPIPTNHRPVELEPTSGSSDVGVTVRPKVIFPKPIDVTTLNSNNVYATFAGRRLPATITPAANGTFAWLFFVEPMPGASQIEVTVDGSSLRTRTGLPLDADGDGTLGGVMRFNFSTVSVAPIPGTVLTSRIVDPGPDLVPRTPDDVDFGDGYIYTLPIQGVKVYLLGLESNVTYTDVEGQFTLSNLPVGNVKVVMDGRTAKNPPAGYYFPEMVIDTSLEPGITNGVMNIVDNAGLMVRDEKGIPIRALAMYLPRVASNVLQTVSGTNATLITLNSNAAYTLPARQQQFLTIEVQPGSLIGSDGRPVSSGQVGVSVVPPELVKDMLPPGLLQHTFDITVQAPGIATFVIPAPMTFPNVFKAAPGTKLNFLSFDHTTGRLVFDGTATVSADGSYLRTDQGTGVTHPGWHGVSPPGTVAIAPRSPPNAPPCGPNFIVPTTSAEARRLQGLVLMGSAAGAGGFLSLKVSATAAKFLPDSWLKKFVRKADSKVDSFNRIGEVVRNGEALSRYYEEAAIALAIGDPLPTPPCGGSTQSVSPAASRPLLAAINQQANLTASGSIASLNVLIRSIWSAFASHQMLQDSVDMIIGDKANYSDLTPEQVAQVQGVVDQMNVILGGKTFDEFYTPLLRQIEELSSQVAIDNDLNTGEVPYYLIQNLNSGFSERLRAGADGRISDLFLAEKTPYRLFLYYPRSKTVGQSDFVSAASGQPTSIPQIFPSLESNALQDSDFDGLSDLAEFIIGTSENSADSDLDGITDLAEVQQGTDPLSGRAFSSGVIANLPVSGEAKEVVLEGSLADSAQQNAYLALGSRGLGIVNATDFRKPILLGQLDLPGDSSDVSVDASLGIAAVAANGSGLHLIDVSDSMKPVLFQTIPGAAAQVEVFNGVAYAAVGNTLRAYDLLTGELLQLVRPGDSVLTGLAREGLFLYSIDASLTLRVFDISGTSCVSIATRGARVMPAGGGRLFVGNGIAIVGAESGFAGGFSTADVSNPDNVTVLSGVDANGIAGRYVAMNGSGFAIAIGSPGNLGNVCDVLNVSDPANTSAFITRFTLPADPFSVAIGGGIAFVADGTAGLQVVNYRAFDNQGVAPVLTVSPPLDVDLAPGLQVEEGSLVRLRAQVSDDVQVRNVELLLDGKVVVNDVSFPWDLSTRMPLLSRGALSATLQVRATDTGGNTTTSAVFTVTLVPDHTPPVVRRLTPISGAIAGSINLVGAYFNEPLDESTLAGTLTLTRAGADEVFATSDDVVIHDGTLMYREDLRAVYLSFSANLVPGVYRAKISPPASDLARNVLAQSVSWQFWVIGGQDSDHDGIPDSIERALGLDPNNPDSNGNGIADGDEDLDGDGLRTSVEVLLGYDPRQADSDGNGIPDGAEDFDHDSLTNLQEQQLGTNPRLADTDGDGWPDEAELTAGSDPLVAASVPFRMVTSNPSVRVVLPRLSDLSLPANTTVAAPSVKVVLPVLKDPLLPLNTVLAQPVVRVILSRLNDASLSANTVIAQPLVRVVIPGFGDPNLRANTIVAQPPVNVLLPAQGSAGDLKSSPTIAKPPVKISFKPQ